MRPWFSKAKGMWLAALLLTLAPLLQAQSVTLTEYPVTTSNSYPQRIALGPDGALWFTESRASKIGKISTDGVITEYTIPTANSGPTGITATGADRALWFTEFLGNKIGRISVDGVISEFTIPTPSGAPSGITADRRGVIWFTEFLGNKIGRITRGGVITEYTIPTSNSAPNSITTASNGMLWFTEFLGNKIGQITPSGVITEFDLPTATAFPGDITAPPRELFVLGLDGVWFTEIASNKIGRITADGVITEFDIPSPQRGPIGITMGTDGALWFAESAVNGIGAVGTGQIGRITSDGVITEYPVPTAHGFPNGITAGPGSTLWFTESGGNNIGVAVVTPDGPVTGFVSRSDFGGNDYLDWGVLGPDGTVFFTPDPLSAQSASGLGITARPIFFPPRRWASIAVEGTSWFGSFAPGENLLRVRNSGILDANLRLTFSEPISGIGAQVDGLAACTAIGKFSMTLDLFNGDTLVGSFTELGVGLGSRSLEDNSAIFIGAKDPSGMGFTSASFVLFTDPNFCFASDFAINTLALERKN